MSVFIVNAVVSFVAALVLHELGHYVAARLCGVPIKQAGFGWGPKLFGIRVSDVDCQVVLPSRGTLKKTTAVTSNVVRLAETTAG